MTTSQTGCDPMQDDAYERYMIESMLDAGSVLPSPLPREHVANTCDVCGRVPTVDNPTTIYAGAPADPENGPHPDEIPFVVCDRCDESEGQ